MPEENNKNGNGKVKIAEHGILIQQLAKDVKNININLTNHISDVYKKFSEHNKEIYAKFDTYKTLFISILVTLIFTLVGVIISITMQI